MSSLAGINQVERRHQVFVSSTYRDLIAARAEVMQVLLELDCIPAGMEMFPAADDTQWGWIRRVIDASDYYLVVSAGKYGSVSPEHGISYTEMEYRFAIETGKPTIAFIHEDLGQLPSDATESDPIRRRMLSEFHELLRQKLCKHYTSAADLGSKVSRAITQLKKQHPSAGWIRAEALERLADPTELLRLSQENEKLRERLSRADVASALDVTSLASGQETFGVEFEYSVVSGEFGEIVERESEIIELSWDTIFRQMAPGWASGFMPYDLCSNELMSFIERRRLPDWKSKYPSASEFAVRGPTTSSLQSIHIQFTALGLIEYSQEEFETKLTHSGFRHLLQLLALSKQVGQARPL